MNSFKHKLNHPDNHLSDYYFDFKKRELLSPEEVYTFSKVVTLANELITQFNLIELDSNYKSEKFKEIKEKIINCHSLSLALEYYLDFEHELHKIHSCFNEYSEVKCCKVDKLKVDASTPEGNNPQSDEVLFIDTETKYVSDNLSSTTTVNTYNNDSAELADSHKHKEECFENYVVKYTRRTGASSDFVKYVISHI